MITVVDQESGRWTKQKAAQVAIEMQDACNMGGVTRALHEIFRAYLLDGTRAANESAPMRLALHQAAWLVTGRLLLADDEYGACLDACKSLAGAP